MNNAENLNEDRDGGSALNEPLEAEFVLRCGNERCFVHEGETCHQGEMQYKNCAMYKQAANA